MLKYGTLEYHRAEASVSAQCAAQSSQADDRARHLAEAARHREIVRGLMERERMDKAANEVAERYLGLTTRPFGEDLARHALRLAYLAGRQDALADFRTVVEG